MNFPEVPIDESLFEGNALMRDYWERSTQNRSVNFVHDVRLEEQELPDDLAELHRLSDEAYEMAKPVAPGPAMKFVETVEATAPTKAIAELDEDPVVLPKSNAGNAWIGVGVGVVFLLVVIYVTTQGRMRY